MQHWIASSNISSRLYLNSNPASMSFFEVKCGSWTPLIPFSSLEEENKLNISYTMISNRDNLYLYNLIKHFTIYLKKDNITHSTVGIWYSGYLAVRSSEISSIGTMNCEQLYLPFGLGCSSRNICALATSSTCTIWKRVTPIRSLLPAASISFY